MSACILWDGPRRKDGYGRVSIDGRKMYAHRWLWEQHHGPLGDLVLHHLCENKRCINLDHLVALTRAAHTSIHAREDRPCRVHGIPRTYEKKTRYGVQMRCPTCVNEAQRRADWKRKGRTRSR